MQQTRTAGEEEWERRERTGRAHLGGAYDDDRSGTRARRRRDGETRCAASAASEGDTPTAQGRRKQRRDEEKRWWPRNCATDTDGSGFWKMNSGIRGTTHVRYARDVGAELGGGGGRPPRERAQQGALRAAVRAAWALGQAQAGGKRVGCFARSLRARWVGWRPTQGLGRANASWAERLLARWAGSWLRARGGLGWARRAGPRKSTGAGGRKGQELGRALWAERGRMRGEGGARVGWPKWAREGGWAEFCFSFSFLFPFSFLFISV
jgi:hypothetical protein